MITIFEHFYKSNTPIVYSSIVLDSYSKNLLLSKFIYNNSVYSDWIKICDHMTICLGELPEHIKRYWLGEEITLITTELGISEKAIAVKVYGFFNIEKPNITDSPKFPHITLAINPINGKPVDSNYIENWQIIEPIKVKGIVVEIKNKF
ncbi:hypothetical protein M0Q97_06815 [Candidatus Dojkabacteria bacterium]|nr:hypothetical protein [Candidatus Dojkabacteria bacterium]